MKDKDAVFRLIMEGAVKYMAITHEWEDMENIASVTKDVIDEVAELVPDDATSTLAFPTAMLRTGFHSMSLALGLEDRVIFAWRQGLIRKGVHSVVVLRSEIQDLTLQDADMQEPGAGHLCTLHGPSDVTFALPAHSKRAARAIVDDFSPR